MLNSRTPVGGRLKAFRRLLRVPGRRAGMAALGAACLAAATMATMASPAVAQQSSRATPGGVVVTAGHSADGQVLFTAGGRALYVFTLDQSASATLPLPSSCTGSCASVWPPLLATGANGPFSAGRGVKASELGTIQRADGTFQVTYFGMPLYEFARDAGQPAGSVTGQDVTNFNGAWYLDQADGRPQPGQATVDLENTSAGAALTTPTASGDRSVYTLTADAPRTTTCTGECAGIWPPLLTDRKPAAGPGVDRSMLGTLRRPDGTEQVTYNGHPVYMFAFDIADAPGATDGEYLDDPLAFGVWYLMSPSGTANPGPLPVASMTASQGTIVGINPPSPDAGRPFPVYAFSADTATSSACTGACARSWPPVLVSGPLTADPASGTDQSLLGTITRPDGTFQVTYNGHPLYFFINDQANTDTGEGVSAFGGTFQVVSLAGAPE